MNQSEHLRETCDLCNDNRNSIIHFVQCIVPYLLKKLKNYLIEGFNFMVDNYINIMLDSSLPIERKRQLIINNYVQVQMILLNWYRFISPWNPPQ